MDSMPMLSQQNAFIKDVLAILGESEINLTNPLEQLLLAMTLCHEGFTLYDYKKDEYSFDSRSKAEITLLIFVN